MINKPISKPVDSIVSWEVYWSVDAAVRSVVSSELRWSVHQTIRSAISDPIVLIVSSALAHEAKNGIE